MNIYTISFLLIILYNLLKNKESMHALQIYKYNENNLYIKWINDNFKEEFISLDLLSLILFFLAFILNSFLSKILIIIALIFYFLKSIYILNNNKIKSFKRKFIVTKSIRRLIVTFSILYILPIIIYLINYDNGLLMLFLESIEIYFSYYIILLAKIINTPLEIMINKYHETKAKDKLKSMPNLKVICITGSYGKSSSKMILNSILSNNYIVSKTPRDLNTTYGFALTINNHLNKNDQIFITDIGSYKEKEIKNICDMIKPKYGIITNIGIPNLETFTSSEEMVKTRFQLIESLDENGIAILNKDDKKQTSYKIKSKCKKIWIGIENKNANINASDITCNENGSKFNVTFDDIKETYLFETQLLGKYNIYNILASIALGKELGISISNLQKEVKKVRQLDGRLELKKYDYMNMIDNTKNTNPIGAQIALDVLKMMNGKKIIITDGINPNLSNQNEKEINYIYGNQIAKINPDMVILVGEKQTKHIFRGLRDSKYDNIYVVRRIDDAYNLIEKTKKQDKIYALFE